MDKKNRNDKLFNGVLSVQSEVLLRKSDKDKIKGKLSIIREYSKL